MTAVQPASVPSHDLLRDSARAWFETLRDQICAAFEQIEDEAMAQSSPTLPGHEPQAVSSGRHGSARLKTARRAVVAS